MVRLGSVTRPQGLRGEVRISDGFDDTAALRRGLLIQIRKDSGTEEVSLQYVRRQGQRRILKVEQIDTIDEAERRLVGADVEIRPEDLPAAAPGSFYTFELRGCQLITVDGTEVGEVDGVHDWGGTELLAVRKAGREYLIPFAKAYVRSIDTQARRIVMDLPEGLLELNP